jgi:hypothetical protein
MSILENITIDNKFSLENYHLNLKIAGHGHPIHACNTSIQENKSRGRQSQGQPGIRSELYSENLKKNLMA